MFVLLFKQEVAGGCVVLLVCPKTILYELLWVSELIFYFADNQHIKVVLVQFGGVVDDRLFFNFVIKLDLNCVSVHRDSFLVAV